MEPLRGMVQRVQRRRIAIEGGNDYKVSVTGLPSRCLNHAKHSAELATGVATPYPAAPDFSLFRGQNKPLNAFL